MPFATARTVTLQGALGHVVDVQADVSPGMIGITLVGRPDPALSEGQHRCRMALQNSLAAWPSTRRVTVLLSPADLPKSGPHFDLAMALAVHAAAGKMEAEELAGWGFIGELTLDGRLRSVHGVLPMVLTLARAGITRVVVPEPQSAEAKLVPGVEVFGARSLPQAVALLRRQPLPDAPPVESQLGSSLLTWRGQSGHTEVDLSELRGMADPKYAVEVAAAGGHHLLLSGPKGAGKTTLAERIPGLLPDLSTEESLELMAVQSLAGTLLPGGALVTRPPFGAPHSSSSRASLLGGGSGRVRPGEVSKAHCGVLFLDEFPLFNHDILEALRQPLEGGEITIGRGDETATFPARGMMVFAANPCPCGGYSPVAGLSKCECMEIRRRDYRRKLQGPVIDRIDITRHVVPPTEAERKDKLARPESTAVVRARVEEARARQAERYAGEPWRTNAQAPGPLLTDRWALSADAQHRLDGELYAGRLTSRGFVKVHRIALTVADLHGVARPGLDELDIALRLRNGEPLLSSVVERRVS